MATTTGRATNPAIASVAMTSPDDIRRSAAFPISVQFSGNPNDALWKLLRDSQGANPATVRVQFVADPMQPGPHTSFDLGTEEDNIFPGVDSYNVTRTVAANILPVGVYELTAILTFFTGPATSLVLVSGLAGFAGDALTVVYD